MLYLASLSQLQSLASIKHTPLIMKTIISAMLVPLVAAATSQAMIVHRCTAKQQIQLLKAAPASDQLVVNAQSYLAKLTADKTEFYERYFGGWGPLQSQIVKLRFDTISGKATSHNYDCRACRAENPDKYHSMDAYVSPKSGTINLCGEFWKKGTTGRDSQAGILLRENINIYKGQVHEEMSALPAKNQRLKAEEIRKIIDPNNYRNFAEQIDKPRKLHRWL